MSKTAVVTGAGSGVGQAVALALAKENWRVALVGRRPEPLRKTVELAGKMGSNLSTFPCDIADVGAVQKMAGEVLAQLEEIEALVNAAGINVPRRSLKELSLEDYRLTLD